MVFKNKILYLLMFIIIYSCALKQVEVAPQEPRKILPKWLSGISNDSLFLYGVSKVANNSIVSSDSLARDKIVKMIKTDFFKYLKKIDQNHDLNFSQSKELFWNDRLKKIEDTLKTNTLWRAPHSYNTIGIPRFELDGMMPVPIPFSEAMLWKNDTNLPMIRQALKHNVLLKWRKLMPRKYSGEDVMRTATGGIAHIKYDLNLLDKAEAVAFGLDSAEIDEYLSRVDRFQAKLGIMRLMLMGSPLGIIGLIATFMLDRAGEISQPSIGYWTFAIIWIISGTAYTFAEPDWRQEL